MISCAPSSSSIQLMSSEPPVSRLRSSHLRTHSLSNLINFGRKAGSTAASRGVFPSKTGCCLSSHARPSVTLMSDSIGA